MNISELKETKIKTDKLILLMICFSLFIFSYELRGHLGVGQELNFIFLFAVFWMFLRKCSNTKALAVLSFMGIIILYGVLASSYEKGIKNIIFFILMYLSPLLLIIIKVDEDVFLKIYEFVLKCLKWILIIMLVAGVLMKFFKINLTEKIVGPFMSPRTYEQVSQSNGTRMYSFMGHPLYNTELYLMYLILSFFYYKYIKEKDCPIKIVILCMAGVAMTASKTGLLLLLGSIICLYKTKPPRKKYMLIFVLLVFALVFNVFGTVIQRFAEGGSLTTGRSEMAQKIAEQNLWPLMWFKGYGNNFTFEINNVMSWASAAYEYPFKMFALERGILMSVLIYAFIGVYPVLYFLKRRQWYIIIGFMVLLADVSTYNGLCTSGDRMALFCLFVMLVMHLSDYAFKKSKEINGGL